MPPIPTPNSLIVTTAHDWDFAYNSILTTVPPEILSTLDLHKKILSTDLPTIRVDSLFQLTLDLLEELPHRQSEALTSAVYYLHKDHLDSQLGFNP